MAASLSDRIATAVSPEALLSCIFDRWSPGIGDPSVMGWVTVAAYLLAGALAFRVAAGGAFPLVTWRRERLFWVLLGFLMLFLAVNKQLDLQSFLTATGRCVAQLQGWYRSRWAVQKGFIVVLAGTMGVLGLILLILMRHTLRRTGLALLGFVFVSGFVLIRAVGFHHMDALINHRIGDVRMNWVLELTGLVFIALGALLHPRHVRRRRRSRQLP